MAENEYKKPVRRVIEKGFDQICEYNSLCDVQEVVSGLAVDITEALQTGVVKDANYQEDNNGISEPSQILGRISDTFDAIEAQRAIHKYGKKAVPAVEKTVEQPASSSGAETPKTE